MTDWPSPTLDRIARLRVLAGALPGTVVVETRLESPYDEVWSWISDLERSVPAFDEDVARLRVVGRRPVPVGSDPRGGEVLDVRTRNTVRGGWFPGRFDLHLADGWCWMTTRPQLYVVGMAAVPDGTGTRFALLEGVAFEVPRPLRIALRPVLAVSRWRHRRHIPRDLAEIRRLTEEPSG